MNYKDYITIEPNKRGGKPCVRGLRITVYEVLEYLASEMTEEEIKTVGETGPTIDSIQVMEFESHADLKEWLSKTAPEFLR